jgi:DNA-binding XRE family transcriptional regulator
MKTNKLERLQAGGWKVGNTADFLQLSDEEARLVALKLSLISAVKKSRIKRKLSQIDLAQRMKSSQSRIAKIEAGDPSVSLDLIVRALIASGATTRDIQVAFTTNERMVGYVRQVCARKPSRTFCGTAGER